MKRLLGVLSLLALTGPLWGQRPPLVYSRPEIPSIAELDRLNLRLEWKLQLPAESRRDGIAIVQHFGSVVLVQMLDGTLYAIAADATGDDRLGLGKVLWTVRFTTSYPAQITPLAASERYFVATRGRFVYVLDRGTGSKVMEYELPQLPTSALAADNDAFYIGMGNGRFVAYSLPLGPEPKKDGPKTGGPAKPQNASGAPARRASSAALLAGLRPQIVWDFQINQLTPYPKIDARREGVRRFNEAPRENVRVETPPAIGQNSVLIANESGTLVLNYRLTPDKELSYPFTRQLDAPLATELASIGDSAYVTTTDGIIYGFDLPRAIPALRETARYIANGRPTNKPIITDDDLFVTTDRVGLVRLQRAGLVLLWDNLSVTRVLAINPKFLYGLDVQGNVLVLDRALGRTLATWPVRDYVFPVTNETNDRLILAAHDGTILSMRDKDYARSVPLKTSGAPPKETQPKPETTPDEKPTPEEKPGDRVEPGKKEKEVPAKPPAP